MPESVTGSIHLYPIILPAGYTGVDVRHSGAIERRNKGYFIRIQTAVICSLLLFILLFRYWPENLNSERELLDRFGSQDLITPEMIILSQQSSVERSAPPVPRPAVTLREEEVVDMTFDLEIDAGGLYEPLSYPEPEKVDELVEQPDRPPNVRRIVEPVMPSGARRDNMRVELEILFTVSAEGVVEEATVVSLRVFNRRTGEFESVEDTGYDFQEITLRAARQWLFHPAEYEGRPVRSQTRHRFTFGEGV